MPDHFVGVEIHCKQEEDFVGQIEWWTDDGDPIKLGDYAKMQVRSGDTLICTLDTTAVEQTPPPIPAQSTGHLALADSGVIQMYIHRTSTANMPAGHYTFDLFVDAPVIGNPMFRYGDGSFVSDMLRAVISGTFIVHPAVTINS